MRRAQIFWTFAVLAAVAAAAHAWLLRWTCDDAYISFRYAQHLVEGHGLLFNLDPQEAPVEGYTNFAWTMLLALGMALGFTGDAIEGWAAFWGSMMHGGTALVLAWAAWRAGRGRALLPVAAMAWAAHHHAASLAPAGLETAMFTLLGAAMLVLAVERRCPRHVLLLGFVGVLAAMTRPDGGLWCAVAGAVVLHDAWRARRPRSLLHYATPFLLTFLPYLIWRRLYYGYWVPNTYFAKSGGGGNPDQGLLYVTEYFHCYAPVLVPAVVALLFVALRRGDLFAAVDPWSGRRPGAVLLAFVVPYVAFVVWVGGDFMFARFLVPVTPLALLALDVALQRWPRAAAAAAVALTLATLWRQEPAYLDDWQNETGISDNRAITVARFDPAHPLSRAEVFRMVGHSLRQLFDGLEVRVAIAGSHANLAYRSRVPVAVETAAGLTDAYIAHLPLRTPGKVGHNRPHTLYPGYLESRGVHFSFELSYGNGTVVDALRSVVFPTQPVPMPARLVTYDRRLMRALRQRAPDLRCVDFERVLDDYLAGLDGMDRGRVARDFAAFRQFYFDHNDDAQRRAAFEQFLAGG